MVSRAIFPLNSPWHGEDQRNWSSYSSCRRSNQYSAQPRIDHLHNSAPRTGPFGYAILADEIETVINTEASFINGNVNLGSGVNKIDNQVGAMFLSAGEIYVGPTSSSVFRNAGYLLPATESPMVYNLTGPLIRLRVSHETRPQFG